MSNFDKLIKKQMMKLNSRLNSYKIIILIVLFGFVEGVCDKEKFTPTIQRIKFFNKNIIESLFSNKSHNDYYKGLITNNSTESIYNLFLKKCGSNDSEIVNNTIHDSNYIELIWKYQLFEQEHCIHVEIDFSNTTRFIREFGYEYYMFIYRRINEKNTYMSRQALSDRTKTLTIHNAKRVPYVICLTFFKNNIINSFDSENNTKNDRNQSCANKQEYARFMYNDENLHDVNLCIDVLSSYQIEKFRHYDTKSGEVMVGFILCLVAFLLVAITLVNFYIERPKKKRIASAIRTFIQKNQFHTSTSNAKLVMKHTATSPAIVLTQPSSENFNNLRRHSGESEERTTPEENQNLLSVATRTNNDIISNTKPRTALTSNNPSTPTKKSFFFIGESIKEEEEMLTSPDNEESLVSVSHILDSKPWATK